MLKKTSEDVCTCVQVSHLCIAYLQCTRVQLFHPGVMCGHQDTVLPPQDGGAGVPRRHAVEGHRAVHSHRLIGRALSDNWWRAIRNDCGREAVEWAITVCGGESVKVFMCCSRHKRNPVNYIELVWENTQKAESGKHLTNRGQRWEHARTATNVGEELNPILRTGNNFLIIQQQETELAK